MQNVKDLPLRLPRSTQGTFPYEYDRVMGVATVGSHESERFGEGNDLEAEDTPDRVAHNRKEMNQTHEREVDQSDVTPGVGEFHGGFGSASLRECVNLATQTINIPSAPCHSEGSVRESPFHMHNSSQKYSTWHVPADHFWISTLGVAATFRKPCDWRSKMQIHPSQEWRKISQNPGTVFRVAVKGSPKLKLKVF